MAEPTGRRAEGVFSPREEGQDPKAYPPAEGFAKAIQDALDNRMDHDDWPPGTYERVRITLSADVTVENPGQIDTYRATFTQ